jgi:hypothetical protein
MNQFDQLIGEWHVEGEIPRTIEARWERGVGRRGRRVGA